MKTKNSPCSKHLAWFLVMGPIAFLIALMLSATASPIQDDDAGSWTDPYTDEEGVYEKENLLQDIWAENIALSAGQTNGWLLTREVRPTSFNDWTKICLTGSPAGSEDAGYSVDIVDPITTSNIVTNLSLVNGCVDIPAGIEATNYPGLQFRIHFTEQFPPAALDSFSAHWMPLTQLSLSKRIDGNPSEVVAGEPIPYRVRYSVNSVNSSNLVIWDVLPDYARGTISPPTNYPGQDDSPTALTNSIPGGLYWPGPGTTNVLGNLIPSNSIYWVLGNVEKGVSRILSAPIQSRNGTLDGTVFSNRAYAAAANGSPITSKWTSVKISSTAKPNLLKSNTTLLTGEGVYDIDGTNWAFAGSQITFNIRPPYSIFVSGNDLSSSKSGDETMYKVKIYDNVSGLLPLIDTNLGDNGFYNITEGGYYDPNFTNRLGQDFPAIVWTNQPIMDPGSDFDYFFSITFLENLETSYVNTACIESEGIGPDCDVMQPSKVGTPPTSDGCYNKADAPAKEIPPHGEVHNHSFFPMGYGEKIKYQLTAVGCSVYSSRDVVFRDMIPPNTTLMRAWSSPMNAEGTIYYYEATGYSDPTNPPPFNYTNLLDPDGLGNWSTNVPAVLSNVTWLAWYFPEMDSEIFPSNNPVKVDAYFNVKVLDQSSAPSPCSTTIITNTGLFQTHNSVDFDGITNALSGEIGTVSEYTFIEPELGQVYVDPDSANISPNPLNIPGTVTYQLTFGNSEDWPTKDSFTNVLANISWEPVLVNGSPTYPQFQDIRRTDGGFFTGAPVLTSSNVLVEVGYMEPGDTASVEVVLYYPEDIENGTLFNINALVTGQDDLCGNSTAENSRQARVVSTPEISVVKSDVLNLIPSGENIDYELTAHNTGTSPSHDTWIVDRIPEHTVFLSAADYQGGTVYFSDKSPPDLPDAVSFSEPLDSEIIHNPQSGFVLGTDTGGGVWSSPYGENTTWVAFKIDDPATGYFRVDGTNPPRQVFFTVRNDHNGPQDPAGGSGPGTVIYNDEGILSEENIQTIGNRVFTTILDKPGLELEKTGPEEPWLLPGSIFEWKVTYKNNSGSVDDFCRIVDDLPPEVSLLQVFHEWNLNAVSNGLPAGKVDVSAHAMTSLTNNPDGSKTCLFNITPDYTGAGRPADIKLLDKEGGTFTFRVQVSTNAPEDQYIKNEAWGYATNIFGTTPILRDSHSVQVKYVDLSISKTGPDVVISGGTATYTLLFANNSVVTATNATLTDLLPADLSYVPGSTGNIFPLNYSIGEPVINGQELTWSISEAIPGNSGQIRFSFEAIVNAGPGETVTNPVSIATATPESNFANNNGEFTTYIPYPDPTITKSANPELVDPKENDTVEWTLEYGNASPQLGTGIYVIDTLPDLAPGDGNADVTVLDITANGPGGIISPLWYHGDPVGSVPTFNITNPAADGWTTNPDSLANVNHIAIPVGTLAGYEYPSGGISILTELNAPLLAGASYLNKALIGSSIQDENPDNNDDEALAQLPGLALKADKYGQPSGAVPGVVPGGQLQWRIRYENNGSVNAYGVRIIDQLPDGVTVDTASLDMNNEVSLDAPFRMLDKNENPTNALPLTYDFTGNRITWYLGTHTDPLDPQYYTNFALPINASGNLLFDANVDPDQTDGASLINTVSVTADVGTPEEASLLYDNTSSVPVIVKQPDLYVQKSVADDPTGSDEYTESGNTLTYRIEYDNKGSIAAEDVLFEELIPEGTRYVENSLSFVPDNSPTVEWFDGDDTTNATGFIITYDTLPAPANFDGEFSSGYFGSDPNGAPVRVDTDECNSKEVTLKPWPGNETSDGLPAAPAPPVPPPAPAPPPPPVPPAPPSPWPNITVAQSNFCQTVADATPVECAILLDFYNSAGGTNWFDNTGWGTDPVVNNWFGIYILGDKVKLLQIGSDNNLNGHIPASFGGLKGLDTIVLVNAGNLNADLPPEIGNLTNLLAVQLYNNGITGNLPPEIANWKDVFKMQIIENSMTGNIPPELGNLTSLTDQLQLVGGFDGTIPPELGNLAGLGSLVIKTSGNLSGNLPAELGNLGNLMSLDFGANDLSGNIPPEWGNLTNLRVLKLYNNQLTGVIPAELGNLTELTHLYLHSNELSGAFPIELINLTKIINTEMHLHRNRLGTEVDRKSVV